MCEGFRPLCVLTGRAGRTRTEGQQRRQRRRSEREDGASTSTVCRTEAILIVCIFSGATGPDWTARTSRSAGSSGVSLYLLFGPQQDWKRFIKPVWFPREQMDWWVLGVSRACTAQRETKDPAALKAPRDRRDYRCEPCPQLRNMATVA